MGLMSDLKEFTTNFMLAAGQGIAENIKQSAKEDKAAILAATKDLKSRIAKNKAAQDGKYDYGKEKVPKEYGYPFSDSCYSIYKSKDNLD